MEVTALDRNQILWVAKNRSAPGSGVKPHSHPYYHMFFLEEGECRFTVSRKPIVLKAGSCLLIPPRAEHSFTVEGEVEYLEIKFTFSKNLDLLVSDNQLVALLFRQILQEYSDLGSIADEAAANYLAALISALKAPRRYEKQRQFRYVDASGASELTQSIIHYLEDHYAEDLSLDMLAAAMGYNKSYLCVAFKKDIGFTILDCLNTIRIRRAAELIVYSDHSLPQVASLTGFASASHFNRVFLKYVGTTPGQCRRAHPGDVYFESATEKTKVLPDRAKRFMYSVLAQKTITTEMIRDLDKLESMHPVTEE